MCTLVFGQRLGLLCMFLKFLLCAESPSLTFLPGNLVYLGTLKVLSLPPQLSQIVMLCCVPPSYTTHQKMSGTNMVLTSSLTLLSGVIVFCYLFSNF